MRYIYFALVVLLSCGKPTNKLFKAKTPTSEVGLRGLSTVMEIDQAVLSQLVANKSATLDIQVPYKGASLALELAAVDLFAPDFVVRTDKGDIVEYEKGLFYSGKVKGDEASMATISIVGGEVSGIIASETIGELNLGKTQEVALEYTLADPNVLGKFDFQCATPDDGIEADAIRLLGDTADIRLNAINTCATIDFEMSYSNFQQFGSSVAVTNWITSIFASVKTLIDTNEGLNVTIKSVFIWTTPDGYDVNPSTALNQLRTKRTGDPNFTGSVVHFVRGKTGGYSGIAYVGVTCVEQYQYGLSDVQFGFAPYPTYSWTTMVIMHELGHNFGSNHTQSCSWPGGAIDGCVAPEGNCARGPIPTNGGTVMSYCHLTNVGIKLTNGFGPLPGSAIRAHIGNTSCTTCGTPPPPQTCTDGILNNGETAIDCGGANCPPCPPPSTDPLVSQGKPARQSSQYRGFLASGAVDGRNDTYNHTEAESRPYLTVDLQSAYKITRLKILNRSDCCVGRIRHFKVFLDSLATYDSPGAIYEYHNNSGLPNGAVIDVAVNGTGKAAKLVVDNGATKSYLHVAEFQLYGTPSGVICKDTIYRVPRIVLVDSTGQICR